MNPRPLSHVLRAQDIATISTGLLFLTGGAFLKHLNFLDFSEFDPEVVNPIYMNFVRHPVERIISWYYYIRSPTYQVRIRYTSKIATPCERYTIPVPVQLVDVLDEATFSCQQLILFL